MSGVIRLSICALILASACDLSTDQAYDQKDQSLAFIQSQILRPKCGTTECHSSFKQEGGDVFDNLDDTIYSFDYYGLVAPGDPNSSYLYTILLDGVLGGDGKGDIMPLDQPLGNAQIALIRDWIANGANGYTPHRVTQ